MRGLCNVAYAARAEGLEEKELLTLDDELVAEPGAKPKGRSHGTSDLMRLMAAGKK